MKTAEVLWKFLRFKAGMHIKPFHRPGFVRGTAVCRHMGITPQRLKELDDQEGLSPFGPVSSRRRSRKQEALWYARSNGFGVTWRYLWPPKYFGYYRMLKERPLRTGVRRPPRKAT